MPKFTPPRPRCSLRVAISGHRWDRMPLAHAATVKAALSGLFTRIGESVTLAAEAADGGYSPLPPDLVLLTGLAEGADRLAAEAAEAAGWRVHAVLPFGVDQYRKDFASKDSPPESATEFDSWLKRADQVTILDGVAGRFDAYVPLAKTLVAQSDLVVAIWDGAPGRGPGGTVDVVGLARRDDVPILRIDVTGQKIWVEDARLPGEGVGSGLSALHHRLLQLLSPPNIPGGETQPRDDYFAEALPRRPPSAWYQAIIALFWHPRGTSRFAVLRGFKAFSERDSATYREDPSGRASRDWSPAWASLASATQQGALDRFGAHFSWADTLANWYASEFRGAFARVFALAWLAVAGAYFSLVIELVVESEAAHLMVMVGRATEVGVLVYILATVRSARKSRLHERWLDYRSLAERLRHLAVLWPLGRTTDLIRVTATPLPGDPRLSWVGWQLRAVAREAGIVPGEWNTQHRDGCRKLLRDGELAQQQTFHEAVVKRALHVSEGLDRMAEGLFWAALGLAIVELGSILTGLLVPHGLAATFGGLAVAMPALAASIHGFLGTADLEGAAIRSAGLSPRLSELIGRLDRNPAAEMTELGDVAEAATRLMETDLSTWHQVTASRRLQAI